MEAYASLQFPDYILKTPLTGDYANLTNKEAKAYFAWFLEIMPKRIDYMLSVCSAEMGIPIYELRMFPDGFLPIWKWFRTKQTLRNSTAEELSAMKQEFGYLGESWVPKQVLDDATEKLHFDIGMFFGDQFVRHYPDDLRWDYCIKPKNYIFVKAPCIWGFKKYINKHGEIDSNFVEPVHLVGSESRQIFRDEMKDDALLRLARHLMQDVYSVETKEVVEPIEL